MVEVMVLCLIPQMQLQDQLIEVAAVEGLMHLHLALVVRDK